MEYSENVRTRLNTSTPNTEPKMIRDIVLARQMKINIETGREKGRERESERQKDGIDFEQIESHGKENAIRFTKFHE